MIAHNAAADPLFPLCPSTWPFVAKYRQDVPTGSEDPVPGDGIRQGGLGLRARPSPDHSRSLMAGA
jgi:hypothetical protein